MKISQCRIGLEVKSTVNTIPVYIITHINSDCTVHLKLKSSDGFTYEFVDINILTPIVQKMYEIVNGIIEPNVIELDGLSNETIQAYCEEEELDNAVWVIKDNKFCNITHDDGCVVLIVDV